MNRSIPPEISSFGPLSISPATVSVLPNGIHLYVERGSEIEVSRLTVAFPGGEAESPRPGLAACANMILIEGTSKMSGEEIANTLEYNGAWVNTSVSTHYSSMTLSSLNDKFADLLPIFADLISSPSFPPTATAGILQRQAARLEIENEKVTVIADKAIRPLVYGGENPLSETDSPEEIRSFTPEELSAFHFSRLDPFDMHIFFSGNVTDEMIAAVRTIFSRFQNRPAFKPERLVFPQSVHKERIDITIAHAQQCAVKMMIPAVGRESVDFVPLRAAVTALGGYFGSRLMLNIREDKGLTYGISAVLLGYPDRSFITVSTQTDGSTKDEVIKLIIEEIEKMKDPSSYTDDELSRLSRFLLSNLAATLDTPFSRMDYIQTHIFAETPINYFEQQDEFARNINASKLAEIASRYFDLSHIVIVTAGN